MSDRGWMKNAEGDIVITDVHEALRWLTRQRLSIESQEETIHAVLRSVGADDEWRKLQEADD